MPGKGAGTAADVSRRAVNGRAYHDKVTSLPSQSAQARPCTPRAAANPARPRRHGLRTHVRGFMEEGRARHRYLRARPEEPGVRPDRKAGGGVQAHRGRRGADTQPPHELAAVVDRHTHGGGKRLGAQLGGGVPRWYNLRNQGERPRRGEGVRENTPADEALYPNAGGAAIDHYTTEMLYKQNEEAKWFRLTKKK